MDVVVRLIGPMVLIAGILAVIEVARRCADGRIGPNPIAGLRTPTIMTDDETWRVGHAAALPLIQRWGMGALAMAIVAAVLPWDGAVEVAVLVGALLILVGCLWGIVVGSRAAGALLERRRGGDEAPAAEAPLTNDEESTR